MSKLQRIADTLSDMEFTSDHQARALRQMMEAYKVERAVAYYDLMKLPGFAMLWLAIEESCAFTCREDFYDSDNAGTQCNACGEYICPKRKAETTYAEDDAEPRG